MTKGSLDPARVAAARAALRGLVSDDDPARGLEPGRIAQQHGHAELLHVLASGDPPLSGAARRTIAVELALRSKGLPENHPSVRRRLGADPREPPPWLLPIESELPPRAIRFGSPGALSRSTPGDRLRATKNDLLVIGSFSEVTTEADRAAITAAVEAWTTESNGRVEVRVFALEGACGSHVDAPLLRALGLVSVPDPAPGLVLEPTRPADALGELFSAAHGGAYNRQVSDTRSRDLAWRSLGALLGLPAHTRVLEVERVATCSGMTRYWGTPFFQDVAWDLGLAVVSESRDRLAILAATDTD